MTHQPSEAHEAMAAELEASGNYRVLRRFQPLAHYGAPDASASSRGVLIDVETTGLDRQHDSVIELAVLPFDYARASGRVGRVHDCLVYREDPGRPIPPDVVRLTGITDAQVADVTPFAVQSMGAASIPLFFGVTGVGVVLCFCRAELAAMLPHRTGGLP